LLISRRSDGLQLVSQQDHARLAGDLAELWGAERERQIEMFATEVLPHIR